MRETNLLGFVLVGSSPRDFAFGLRLENISWGERSPRRNRSSSSEKGSEKKSLSSNLSPICKSAALTWRQELHLFHQ